MTEPTTTTETRQTKLGKAYAAANAKLREKHLDEFNGYYQDEARQRGEEWTPKPTPKQKAEAELKALISQFPDLAPRYGRTDETPSE